MQHVVDDVNHSVGSSQVGHGNVIVVDFPLIPPVRENGVSSDSGVLCFGHQIGQGDNSGDHMIQKERLERVRVGKKRANVVHRHSCVVTEETRL